MTAPIQGMFDSLLAGVSLSHCYEFRPKPTQKHTLTLLRRKHTDRGKCSRIQLKQTKHCISESTLQLINKYTLYPQCCQFSVFIALVKSYGVASTHKPTATHVHTKKQKCDPAVYSQTEVSDCSREISII